MQLVILVDITALIWSNLIYIPYNAEKRRQKSKFFVTKWCISNCVCFLTTCCTTLQTKSRTHESGPPPGVASAANAEEKDVPRSIVAKANKVSPVVGELVRDIRKLMSPYTANNLREKR